MREKGTEMWSLALNGPHLVVEVKFNMWTFAGNAQDE
jgi:hypothetical protein